MPNKVMQQAVVLGLTGRISAADVKAAYRRTMREWHPDLHYGKMTAAVAHTKAQAINAAYEFLSEITEGEPTVTVGSPAATAYDSYETRHTYQQRGFWPGFPDPGVFEVFVKSSMLVSAGYDAERRVLYLKFQNGTVYRYLDVSKATFDELLRADSIGRYANAYIIKSFKYERC